MDKMSEFSVLTRILEFAPLLLSIPASWLLFRAFRQTHKKIDLAAAMPLFLFAVATGSAFVTQGAWLLTNLGVKPEIAMHVFIVGRLTRSLLFMIACLALERVWTIKVLRKG